ncbi:MULTISPECIES: LLM class flavin-dependent oxidoreductase [Gemmobacter]|jgi:alkanesulfonate monooxygenase SsuD/methylene tetrahydromethanopterin reductase-like flavin-dependent oxidoreductase (luciferase family)|uniref:Alkanesulfonate monooxygenase SsuD/methylene tetrahydromethanopterin reductase-like flavin-dependent oxidoreductase (Luciferase family) n=2 Tax=Gemmobacter TaxID=204456 RepID=A0A2T6B0L8_9RHOB|nr:MULTISPECIES: LLM class flavin-dependent oxidoreductase [Gemmobacter]PTX49572.1 alkanesulfonate monooxygenase SsuD/methylene tetrahydromethanopterin reductase-like flavin-dependent oxidoreductase (luciferase family) [Gemmobacter caeni]TWJ00381.1 alkanesulfonate monooxygenase SsuD/methylene tetrahydromethanopterin reductase-like flavin-dependent oxidoreductase (luciferase family) [Gemmobacter caeni]GHC20033.1 monooxygenase [Gemmobacter nanjingensis]
MKFSLFIHMERVSAEEDQKQLYDEMIALCRIADEGGMHAIWTGEHHGMNFTIAPNPLLNLVDLAHQTKNVRLGTGTVIAPFWHPIRLAGEAAMADIITGGRLELGIARGAYNFEYERLMPGMDAWGAGGRMRELVPAIKALWQGDYAHDGEYWQFPKTTSAPLPMQQPHPPIWVAARDPNSHEFAVSQGCNVQVTPLHLGDEEVQSLMERFNAACAKFPEIARPRIMVLRHTYVADSEADAQQGAEELNMFYNYFGAWFKNERPISMGLIETLTPEDVAAHPFYSAEAMRKNQIIGEAPEVIERIKSYEAMGYDEFSFWIDSGMSFARKKASLERFIRDVMPAFA